MFSAAGKSFAAVADRCQWDSLVLSPAQGGGPGCACQGSGLTLINNDNTNKCHSATEKFGSHLTAKINLQSKYLHSSHFQCITDKYLIRIITEDNFVKILLMVEIDSTNMRITQLSAPGCFSQASDR